MERIITVFSVALVVALLATHPSIGLVGPVASASPTLVELAPDLSVPRDEVECTMQADFWEDEYQERGRWRRTFNGISWFFDGPPIRRVTMDCFWMEGMEIRQDFVDAPDCDDTGNGWYYTISQRGESSDICWFNLEHTLENQE